LENEEVKNILDKDWILSFDKKIINIKNESEEFGSNINCSAIGDYNELV